MWLSSELTSSSRILRRLAALLNALRSNSRVSIPSLSIDAFPVPFDCLLLLFERRNLERRDRDVTRERSPSSSEYRRPGLAVTALAAWNDDHDEAFLWP